MLKYKIEELLNQLPYWKLKLSHRWLPNQLGVTPKTWREWKRLKLGETRDIPAEKLFQIASFFAVEPADLFTEAPEPIQALKPEWNAAKISQL